MALVNRAVSWVAASDHRMVTRPAVIKVMSTQPGTSPRSGSATRRSSPSRTMLMPVLALAATDWMRFMRVLFVVVQKGYRPGSDREVQERNTGIDREQNGDRKHQKN